MEKENFIKKFIEKHKLGVFDNIEKVIDLLYDIDPSSNKKYLYWLYRIFSSECEYLKYWDDVNWVDVGESLLRLENYPERFKNAGYSTDIFSYTNSESFISKSESAFLRTNKQNVLKNDIDLVDDFNGIVVLYPSTFEASCYYGRGTRWCTSKQENYDDYTNEGYLFFILNKSSNGDDYKTAIFINGLVSNFQVFDSTDNPITDVKFEDIDEIEYYKTSSKITYPKRILKSIKSFIDNTVNDNPIRVSFKVFRDFIKSLGKEYTGRVNNAYYKSFYLFRYKILIGEYRVFDQNEINEEKENFKVDDINWDNSKFERIIKHIGEEKLLTYLNLDTLFDEILLDSSRFRFYDEYNIDDLDEMTPELDEIKKEFLSNPIKFYDDNIYKGTESKPPKYTTYKTIVGIMYHYYNSYDMKSLVNDYFPLFFDKIGEPIIREYNGEKYFIINYSEYNEYLYD
jgi:hypothetical protein